MKFPILVSYAYARDKEELFNLYINNPNVEVLLDCGAFTAKNTGKEILLKDYCAFLDKWQHKLFRYLALDVVGNPVETEANLKQMLKDGYAPAPVHVLGDDQQRMDELFGYSDYVALAGLRRPHKGGAPKDYVAAKMKWAKGRNVHWLGYVREDMIAAYKPYSCDSASWNAATLYGRMCIYLGNGKWLPSIGYDNRDKIFKNKTALKIIEDAGYSTKNINEYKNWIRNKKQTDTEFFSHCITAESWVRYVIDIYHRYGTKVFMATSLSGYWMDHPIIEGIKKNEFKLHLDHASV